MIIEDELSRTRDHREKMKSLKDFYVKQGAPIEIINHIEYLGSLTNAEYQLYLQTQRNNMKNEAEIYSKSHKMRKEVVQAIWKWFDEYKFDKKEKRLMQEDNLYLWSKLDPLGKHIGMSLEEYEQRLYEPLIFGLLDRV